MPNESVTREVFGNIDLVSKGIFYFLAAAALGCFAWRVHRRARLWRLGRESPDRAPIRPAVARLLKRVLLPATWGKERPQAGTAHWLLFGGFAVLLVGTILIAVEHSAATALGRAATEPVFHKGFYFAVYEALLDTAGLALLAGTLWFMRRRWRGGSSFARGRMDWIVLGTLAALCVTGYLVEGLRIIREQTPWPGYSYVGLGVARGFEWLGIDRPAASGAHFGIWWIHALLALGFIAVFPYTRLLHAVAGAINLAMDPAEPGVMTPVSLAEVEETGLVGVGRPRDFTRRQLLQLDACVSCGRCQDVCPAFEAGKPLSPRDVVRDLRLHLEAEQGVTQRVEQGVTGVGAGTHDGGLLADETVWSCTTCHACTRVCPLGVDPMGLLTDLRRNLVAETQLRGPPATSLRKTQSAGNPWGMPADERLDWAEGLDVPLASGRDRFDVLYWVGCAAAYDRRAGRVARAVVRLLLAADVNFAVLGSEERCTGEAARRMGDEFLFQEMAASNLAVLRRHDFQTILTHCPHCFNSFLKDYPQLGGRFQVVHHSSFLAGLIEQGKLQLAAPSPSGSLTYHDPCYLARVNHVTQPPRQLIGGEPSSSGPNPLVEMARRGRDTACCGAGGGRMWFDDPLAGRIGGGRVDEILATGARTVAVGCPFCLTMLSDGVAPRDPRVQVKDVAELLVERLETVTD